MKIVNTFTSEELNTLRSSVQWRTISDPQASRAIKNSMALAGICDNDELVAIGRLVGDGCFKAMLTDVIVRPDQQGKGYGRIIIQEILKQAEDLMLPNDTLCIEACPTEGNRDFYIRCGFTYDPKEQDGVSLWLKKEDR